MIPINSEDLEIIIHISNFHHAKGGIKRSLYLGTPEQITRYGKINLSYDLLLVTIILIMNLYIFWLYISLPSDKSPLYFGLVCFFTITHLLVNGEMLIVYYLNGVSWETIMKIDFTSNYMRAAFFAIFLRNIFPEEISRYFAKGMFIGISLFSLLILFTRAEFYSKTLVLFEIIVSIAIVYIVYGLIMALVRRRRGAVFSAIGIFALLATAINDILYNEMIINSVYLFPGGLFVCIYFHSFLLSARFTKLYKSVSRLSRRLLSLDKIKNAFITNTSKYNLEIPFKAILENTNSDKGFIYIWEEENWILKVFMSLIEKEIMEPLSSIADFSVPVEGGPIIPYNLINMAIEEQRDILMDNVLQEDSIKNDLYIQKYMVKSALCMRIVSCENLIGLLYLENQRIEGAFNKEILGTLDLLSPQLTTMLDNIEIFRQLELLNMSLEQKVKERTIELTRQKLVIEAANQKINDSINYAKHIQDSILLPEDDIKQFLSDLFIYNRPREIVSGDFYWFSKVNDTMVIAAIDCTGHGVPGAFMSMIGNTLLNGIVNEMKTLKPSKILKYLNHGIKQALRQNLSETHAQDGMDIALCTINLESRTLQYCGAKNPLYLIRDQQLKVIKADPWSIGGQIKRSGIDKEIEFTNHIISLDHSVSVYMFTDGYMDQFGGEDGEKFSIDRYKKLLIEISEKTMEEQKIILNRTMEEWKENQQQIDDMLVIGIRF